MNDTAAPIYLPYMSCDRLLGYHLIPYTSKILRNGTQTRSTPSINVTNERPAIKHSEILMGSRTIILSSFQLSISHLSMSHLRSYSNNPSSLPHATASSLSPFPQSRYVISHRCAFGAIKKKFSNSILSGVVLAASLIPLHSLKKNATAYLNSMRAR